MSKTGLRETWQWGTGTAGIFLAWLNLLLFTRRGPGFGIFVIMLFEVLQTFAKFFVVFSPLLFGFCLAFHSLLANQTPFRDPQSSVMKALAMVIGELDVDSRLFERAKSSEFEDQVVYWPFTYALFVIFIILMPIVMMNLLVGLAVDDIKEIQRRAHSIRQQMKIKTLFHSERVFSRWIKNLGVPKSYEYKPNNTVGGWHTMFELYFRQSTSTSKQLLEHKQSGKSDQAQDLSYDKRLDELKSQNVQIAKTLNQIVQRLNSNDAVRDLDVNVEDQVDIRFYGRRGRSAPQTMQPIKLLHVDEDLDEEPVEF